MKNNNSMSFSFKIPQMFKNKISINIECELLGIHYTIFNNTLELISRTIANESKEFQKELKPVTICFQEYDSLDENFKIDIENSTIIYNMKAMKLMRSFDFIFYIFIEGLVCYYWKIPDTYEAKIKALNIIKTLAESMGVSTLKKWGLISTEE